MTGRLVGIGVGPGDPELLTLKALRRLKEADVIVSVAAAGRPSRARAIVEAHLPPATRELTVAIRMTLDALGQHERYAPLVADVDRELAAGHMVAVLCEGDPLLFGTFIHLLAVLPSLPAVEVVPGIPSPLAAAAAEAWPLGVHDQATAVLPATMGTSRLREALRVVDRAAIIKVGQRLAEVRALLAELGVVEQARLVVELGGVDERRVALNDWDQPTAPYFSLVLTPGGGGHDG